jgi:hydroxymethylpyrimidine/phosphomethylpyrimidine kinase
MPKTVLTIAGFDPSSGAGVTADLMVFAAHGLFGTSCITALTVQSTLGVRASYPVSGEIVGETLDWLTRDIRPDGIKIGMMADASNVIAISNLLEQNQVINEVSGRTARVPVVLDPVLRSSSGHPLLDEVGLQLLRGRLLPMVDWVTPNLHELGELIGGKIINKNAIASSCQELQETAASISGEARLGVLATGGDQEPPDDLLVLPGGQHFILPGKRITTRATHGTGCALSSAFLSRLVLGYDPLEAALGAKSYVTGALVNAPAVGSGDGPINHLWELKEGTG